MLLGALQKLLGGQKACVLTLATCLWQSRDAVVSASGLVPQVCPGTPRDSRPHGGLHLVQGPGWTQGPAWTHGRGAVVPNTRDCARCAGLEGVEGRVVFPENLKIVTFHFLQLRVLGLVCMSPGNPEVS